MMNKFREWTSRYLVAEIIGTITCVIFVYLSFLLFNNLIISSYVGAIAENFGYYGYILNKDKSRVTSLFLRVKNLFFEFGLSEVLDTLVVRAFCIYIFSIMFDNYLVGCFVGKIVADVIFYIITIVCYELRSDSSVDL